MKKKKLSLTQRYRDKPKFNTKKTKKQKNVDRKYIYALSEYTDEAVMNKLRLL